MSVSCYYGKVTTVYLLLRKCIFPYEYVNDSEKFIRTWLPEKEDCYSHLNMEDITVTDNAHENKMIISGEYHGIFVHSNTLLLADVFGNVSWNIRGWSYKICLILQNLF